jgi:hypothetical protein
MPAGPLGRLAARPAERKEWATLPDDRHVLESGDHERASWSARVPRIDARRRGACGREGGAPSREPRARS